MKISGDAIPALEAALRFRVARQKTLAANVANADTPGYRRADVRFDAALEAAAAQPARTDPRHLGRDGGSGYRVERGEPGTRPDGNGVELDQELIEVARNASAFAQQSSLLSRLIGLQRTAIQGSRR